MKRHVSNDSTSRLQRCWREVRRTYFPRWDTLGTWKVRAVPGRLGDGECRGADKLIVLTPPVHTVNLERVLIHEVCHVRAPGHGRSWQKKMRAIVERARKLGRDDLALALREELNNYRKSPRITAACVYDRVRQLGYGGCQAADEAIELVSCELGITPAVVVAKYPRFRSTFKESAIFADDQTGRASGIITCK